jgi:hypothetical protein
MHTTFAPRLSGALIFAKPQPFVLRGFFILSLELIDYVAEQLAAAASWYPVRKAVATEASKLHEVSGL